MLELEWTLRHTGGLPLHSISVTCSGGNSTTLSNRSVCTPDMCGDDGSTRLGPVMAGSSYTCSVTASNAVGNTTSDTNTVITLTGKLLAYHHWISVYFGIYFHRYPIHSCSISECWWTGEATGYHCLCWSGSRRQQLTLQCISLHHHI